MDARRLRQLSVFRTIASRGGIIAAAESLGKSPSAVHHDLKMLEAESGRALFERVGRRLKLTIEGQRLAASVAHGLGALDSAYANFVSGRDEAATLRISAVSGFGRYRLVPRLLANADDSARLELQFGSHDDVLRMLSEGMVDFAFTYRPVVASPIRSELFAEEELVLICPSKVSEPAGLSEIAAARFVTYDEHDYVFGRWFGSIFDTQPAALNRSDHASELEEALMAVAAGRGATIAPFDAWANGPWRSMTKISRPNRRRCANQLYLLGIGSSLNSRAATMLRSWCGGDGPVSPHAK